MSTIAGEKNFENKLKKFLKEQNCWFIKYWAGGGFTKSGIPDLLICCNGFFIGAEVKDEHGSPSELQKWTINEIKKAGGIALVVYPKDFEKFKRLILFLKTYDSVDDNIVY